MQKYIGTKIIEAEPCLRKAPSEHVLIDNGYEAGYKVRYPDGYESWSPKDVFEEAYRPTDCMSFGLAIEAMKKGKKVARRGWNGKGMFLYLVDGSEVPFENLRDRAARFITENSTGRNAAKICGHIDMKAADGSVVVGWLASQTDMLADDWEVVE